ncbi:hypothetical protein PybrP1_007735, partial [[Pythium] brassicae (nom. inval.)]
PMGESRGFGFVDFQSTEDAKQVVLAYTHGPLLLDGKPVVIGYTDNNRTQQRYGAGGPGSFADNDWICPQCDGTNFARRTACFKCETPRPEHARETPHDRDAGRYGDDGRGSSSSYGSRYDASAGDSRPHNNYGDRQESDFDGPPTPVVLVRDLPQFTEEGELHIAFAEFEGVRDIRLIRDRVTGHSRGFGFVEFADVESAAAAIGLADSVRVHGARVRLSFARGNAHPPPRHRSAHAGLPPHVPNSIAAAALEQAQWSLANGYGGSGHQEPSLDSEVTSFLESVAAAAAAAAAPPPPADRPKKQWPLPFETGGGSFVFAGEHGLYYDADSMFYYDTQSKLYYSAFSGEYFCCRDGATFALFAPPAPSDDAPLTLSKKEKKPLAFGAVTGSSVAASKLKDAFSGDPPAAVGATPSMKRKSADDIAKWSQLQRGSKDADSGKKPAPLASPPVATSASPAAAAALDTLVSAAAEAPICLLCRRKFTSMELLRKHETLSALHQANLAKAKAHKDALAAQYRELEQERKERAEEEEQDRKRQRVAAASAAPAAPSAASAAPPSLETGIGGKMLKMMGWKSGEGLGKHGTGITAPVAAVGNVGSDTAGIGARPAGSGAPTVDVSDLASYKERLQQMARARYDAAPRSL